MGRNILFWFFSIVITLGSVFYQRITGPTYPVSSSVILNGKHINYKLERSHSSSGDYNISIKTNDSSINGLLEWKRYKTNDAWNKVPMTYRKNALSASLPKQPSAGKLQYKIVLSAGEQSFNIPSDKYVIIRFKDDVSLTILIPHIFAMFGAMLLSTRTGLEIFRKEPKLKKYTFWTLGFLIAGGMILGPLVQLYAFGALWTGIPFGTDLTDNKTLIALIGWIIAAIAIYKSKKPRAWVMGAAVLLFLIYLIPHSMFGSELDYNKLDKTNKKIETVNSNFQK